MPNDGRSLRDEDVKAAHTNPVCRRLFFLSFFESLDCCYELSGFCLFAKRRMMMEEEEVIWSFSTKTRTIKPRTSTFRCGGN